MLISNFMTSKAGKRNNAQNAQYLKNYRYAVSEI